MQSVFLMTQQIDASSSRTEIAFAINTSLHHQLKGFPAIDFIKTKFALEKNPDVIFFSKKCIKSETIVCLFLQIAIF